MSHRERLSVTPVWIPWVLAVAALFGWSAVVPDSFAAGKGKRQEEAGQLLSVDDLPAPTPAPQPVGHLAVSSPDRGLPAPAAVDFLRISRGVITVEAGDRAGEVQGRAPPRMA
jgi:hypothetical protein